MCFKGKDSWFGTCVYYLFACARFLAQAYFVIVYEPIVSKLPNSHVNNCKIFNCGINSGDQH